MKIKIICTHIVFLYTFIMLASCFGRGDSAKQPYVPFTSTANTKDFILDYNNKYNNKLKFYNKDYKNQVYYQLIKHGNNSYATVNDVFNVMGNPKLIKSAKNLELWQYKGQTCIINFVWSNSGKLTINAYNFNLQNISYPQCIKDYVVQNNTL